MTAPRQKNDLQAEIERYRKSLEENPGSRLFAALADAMRRSGDIAGAISVAENGLKRHPRYLGGMVVLGQAYADHQQFDRGKELFLQVVRMNPENLVAQRALAEIYEKLGENFNAMRTYAILNILDPSDKKVRARLQELEESRAGASRPASAPKPFSVPPAAATPAPAASSTPRESDATAESDPPVAPLEVAAPPPAPVEPAPVPEATMASAAVVPDGESDPFPLADAVPADTPVPPDLTLPHEPPPPAPGVEIEKRMAGLNQFFAGDQDPEPESAPSVSRSSEPPAPPDQEIPRDEGSDTAVMPVVPESPPAPPPPPSLTIEDKLDLFFGGADLNRVGIAESAEDFVVRPAQDALAEPASENPAPPPLAVGAAVTINHSKLGAIFWDQGFREKALAVMAEEIRSRPGDALLRAEFNFAARSIDRDPEAMLESIRPGLSVRTVEPAPAPEAAPETGAEPTSDPAPDPTPDPAPASPADAGPEEATAKTPDETSSTDQRINILRSYLKRVRKDKEI